MGRTLTIAAALVLLAGAPAWAGPTDQLREYTDQVIKVLDDPSMARQDRRAAVRKIAHEAFDVAATRQRVRARHWQARTQAEREEFTQLFADLLERTYIARMDEYGGERIRYVSESIDGKLASVRARITTRNGTEVAVESRMNLRGDRWLIYDVLIENVSLVANYRPGQNEMLDLWSDRLQEFLHITVEQGGPAAIRAKNWLNGVWLGHPLHPALTDVALGAWWTGSFLDLVGVKRTADAAITLGVLSVVPTALSGAADWADTSDEQRRTGLVHALLNS